MGEGDALVRSRTRKRLAGERLSAPAERGVSAKRCGTAASHLLSPSAAAMSSDFESYEQDFAVLTAEITGRIGKVPKLVGGERRAPAAGGPRRGRGRPACWTPPAAALAPHRGLVLLVCRSLPGSQSRRLHSNRRLWRRRGLV